jgi:hypothetical protein
MPGFFVSGYMCIYPLLLTGGGVAHSDGVVEFKMCNGV